MLTTVLGAAFWWAVFVLVFRQDRRRVRNGVFFLIAAHSTLTLMARSIESTLPFGDLLVLASTVVVFIGVLALGAFMIGNGLTMVRKEGRSLGNMLSLLAGLALFAAPVASLALVLTQNAWAIGLGALVFLVSLHLGVAFLIFLSASVLYQLFPRRLAPTGIIRSEEHTSELQSRGHIVCRLLLEKIKLIHPDRTINELAGKYDRMDRFDCRKVLAKEVYYKAFMIEILPHIHSGGHSQRSDAVVQP